MILHLKVPFKTHLTAGIKLHQTKISSSLSVALHSDSHSLTEENEVVYHDRVVLASVASEAPHWFDFTGAEVSSGGRGGVAPKKRSRISLLYKAQYLTIQLLMVTADL